MAWGFACFSGGDGPAARTISNSGEASLSWPRYHAVASEPSSPLSPGMLLDEEGASGTDTEGQWVGQTMTARRPRHCSDVCAACTNSSRIACLLPLFVAVAWFAIASLRELDRSAADAGSQAAVFGGTAGVRATSGGMTTDGHLEGKSLVEAHGGAENRTDKHAEKACLGVFDIRGYGTAALVGAAWNKPLDQAGRANVESGRVLPGMKSRAYIAASCAQVPQAPFDRNEYAAMRLLGRTFRYTVDLSGAGCGCNAALYLVAMPQVENRTDCGDYYCDANAVCGSKCVEIDIQEANTRAWYTTVHASDDPVGDGGGYGAGRRTWNSTEYGLNGTCIDTTRPFQVAATFTRAKINSGPLAVLEVTLSQVGKPCPLTVRIDKYKSPGGDIDGFDELSEALEGGMTPVISYWGAGEKMPWLDGPGTDNEGPCPEENASECSESVVFSDFALL